MKEEMDSSAKARWRQTGGLSSQLTGGERRSQSARESLSAPLRSRGPSPAQDSTEGERSDGVTE